MLLHRHSSVEQPTALSLIFGNWRFRLPSPDPEYTFDRGNEAYTVATRNCVTIEGGVCLRTWQVCFLEQGHVGCRNRVSRQVTVRRRAAWASNSSRSTTGVSNLILPTLPLCTISAPTYVLKNDSTVISFPLARLALHRCDYIWSQQGFQ